MTLPGIRRWRSTSCSNRTPGCVEKVLAGIRLGDMELEAIRYCYIPSQEIGLAGVVVKPTPALLGLQAALIEAVAPFTKASGEHFNPHVSTGVATRKDLDQMLAEPFESFGFAFSGAAAVRSAIPERA